MQHKPRMDAAERAFMSLKNGLEICSKAANLRNISRPGQAGLVNGSATRFPRKDQLFQLPAVASLHSDLKGSRNCIRDSEDNCREILIRACHIITFRIERKDGAGYR